jgi:hypothetical protein
MQLSRLTFELPRFACTNDLAENNMNHRLSNCVASTLFCVILLAITGCPAQPPKTQRAKTAAEFQQLLSTVVPPGTTKEDAQHTLKYGEGLRAKEIVSGDFTQNPGEPIEKVHKDIHYLHSQCTITLVDGRLKRINIAFVLENDRVTKILANEVIVEPKKISQETS